MQGEQWYGFKTGEVKPRVLHKIQLPGYVETLEEVDTGSRRMQFSEAFVRAEHLEDYRKRVKRNLQSRLWEDAMMRIDRLVKDGEPREHLMLGMVHFEEEPWDVPGDMRITGTIKIYRKVRGSEVLVEAND